MKKKAIVIGSGFGGIASALRLKGLGYDVSIFEKLDQLGGRARVFKKNGFIFDAGPTVITAPFLFDELFELFNKKRENYVEFIKICAGSIIGLKLFFISYISSGNRHIE